MHCRIYIIYRSIVQLNSDGWINPEKAVIVVILYRSISINPRIDRLEKQP